MKYTNIKKFIKIEKYKDHFLVYHKIHELRLDPIRWVLTEQCRKKLGLIRNQFNVSYITTYFHDPLIIPLTKFTAYLYGVEDEL